MSSFCNLSLIAAIRTTNEPAPLPWKKWCGSGYCTPWGVTRACEIWQRDLDLRWCQVCHTAMQEVFIKTVHTANHREDSLCNGSTHSSHVDHCQIGKAQLFLSSDNCTVILWQHCYGKNFFWKILSEDKQQLRKWKIIECIAVTISWVTRCKVARNCRAQNLTDHWPIMMTFVRSPYKKDVSRYENNSILKG